MWSSLSKSKDLKIQNKTNRCRNLEITSQVDGENSARFTLDSFYSILEMTGIFFHFLQIYLYQTGYMLKVKTCNFMFDRLLYHTLKGFCLCSLFTGVHQRIRLYKTRNSEYVKLNPYLEQVGRTYLYRGQTKISMSPSQILVVAAGYSCWDPWNL